MKKHFVLSIFILLCLSFSSLAQLDSVYYLGPSQGSVVSGAMQNTDDFPDNLEIIQGEETRTIPNVNRDFNSEPMIMDFDNVQLPEYVYVEDPSVSNNDNPNQSGNGGGALLNNFTGFLATNATPPDPSMAVGPNHIVATVNGFPSFFRIFDKQGNILKTITVSTWFAPVSPDESGDGQVIYDHFEGRWVLSFMQVNTGNQTAANLIAYSDDDNPIGTWYVYRFDTKMHGTVQSNTWGDYPQIGFDSEAIYIATRIFGFSSGFFGTKFRVIDKAELYNSNGGSVSWWDFWNIRRPNPSNPPAGAALDNIHPTFSYSVGDEGYLFWSSRSTFNKYVLYKFFNPTADPPRLRGKDIDTELYRTTLNANQLGGGTLLETRGSGCFTSPIVKDGKMYISHSVGNSSNSTYASIRYSILDLNTQTIEEHAELGAIGYYYFYPTIAVDESNNIAITFARSADTEYAGAFYTTKTAGDPPGLQPSVAVQEGLGNYQAGGDRNRWGDYMAIYLDPSNNHDIFLHTEYANSGNSWATVIGHLIAAPYQGAYAYSSPGYYDFGDIETGTTSPNVSIVLANYGDMDLTITDIPSSLGDFTLETTLSFPITLATYDSVTVEFSFTPSVEGLIAETYPVSSNDPQFTGIELSGTGYDVIPALEQTFYASTGSQSNGSILTIDPVTGNGTNVGESSFSEITSISIDPNSGKLYGLIAGAGSSELVKINASGGDAYSYKTINIAAMSGIAFDTTGTLYGVTRTGDVYTIDIEDGSTNFIIDAEGSYIGLTFHPATNELWATSRAFLPPENETIFKVNLSTGDTTNIGRTGLGKPTNAIAFDNNLNLYGVIGSSAQDNDFVSINTTNGNGAIIGSIGYQNVLGLAYLDQITTGIDDNENGISPSDYSLKQNYPNPFNPNTRIEFSIPMESSVKLVIYNILGQEVVRLVDNEMTAGIHSISWNAEDATGKQLTSGIYLYKLTASGIDGSEFNETKKMILLK